MMSTDAAPEATDKPRILVLFAHPAFHKSRVHRALADAARRVEGVTFHDLYERYPDFLLDVNHEQQLLREHDLIVFQHPFYWYSSPAILKEWQDLVLEYGFAFGEEGTALRGKRLLSVVSAGGPQDSYGSPSHSEFTMAQLLTPFEQTARFCGMEYLPPFVVHGARGLSPREIHVHAEEYTRMLTTHRDGVSVQAPPRESGPPVSADSGSI